MHILRGFSMGYNLLTKINGLNLTTPVQEFAFQMDMTWKINAEGTSGRLFADNVKVLYQMALVFLTAQIRAHPARMTSYNVTKGDLILFPKNAKNVLIIPPEKNISRGLRGSS
jgi:hypothetical protein